MTTKSDRNLSHEEAVAAGLVSMRSEIADLRRGLVYKPPGAAMTYDTPDPSYDQSNNKQLMDKLNNKKAVKADFGKLDWSLVPFEALEGMVNVLEFGAKKYARHNWQEGGGFEWTRTLAACLRHIFAFMRGEDNDPESGLSHISHAQCNLLFIAYYVRNKGKFNKDNRNVR